MNHTDQDFNDLLGFILFVFAILFASFAIGWWIAEINISSYYPPMIGNGHGIEF